MNLLTKGIKSKSVITCPIVSLQTKGEARLKQLTKCGVERAGEILDKSPMAVYQDVARRKIPFRKLGKRVFFFEEELYEFLAKQPGLDVDQALASRS